MRFSLIIILFIVFKNNNRIVNNQITPILLYYSGFISDSTMGIWKKTTSATQYVSKEMEIEQNCCIKQ